MRDDDDEPGRKGPGGWAWYEMGRMSAEGQTSRVHADLNSTIAENQRLWAAVNQAVANVDQLHADYVALQEANADLTDRCLRARQVQEQELALRDRQLETAREEIRRLTGDNAALKSKYGKIADEFNQQHELLKYVRELLAEGRREEQDHRV